MKSNIFDRLSFLSLFLVIVLLPIFSLPFTKIPIGNSKGLILVVGLVACIIFWAIARFLDGKIVLPKSWLLVSGFGISLVFLLSALFSSNSQVSMFGTMFDIGSFWFIFSGFVLLLCSSVVFRTPKQAEIVLSGTILSSIFVLVFQGAHLFMPKILSLGIFTDKTSNLLGSWNMFGLFAGFSILLFLFVVEFFSISRMKKIILEIFIFISILLVASVNFSLIWILIGISSLVIFVYKVSLTFQKNENDEGQADKRNFPMISFIVVMISLLFFISGNFIGNFIPNRLQISNTEVGPSFGATLSVTKEVLAKHPILGIGPNRFEEAWSMYKPVAINNTDFWNTSFDSGSGLLPTLVSTTGSLGILSWVVFLVLFLVIGVKSIFSSIKNGINWVTMAFFVLSLYLFLSSFFYSTGAVIFLLSLAFTGVFIGLVTSSSDKKISISFLNDHRKSFFSILFIIFIIIISATVSFKYFGRFASMFYFEKALSASEIGAAESFINKAISLHSSDLYLRTYSQIYLVKLNSLVNKVGTLSDAEKVDLQKSFDQAVSSAVLSTEYNPSNYRNFQLLGSVYQTAGLLSVKDAYSMSIEAYKKALALNPNNPGLKLIIANLFFVDGKTANAKDYINQSLSLKPDYVDAFLSLSQIAKSEGEMDDALSYAKKALAISPKDADLIKYVDSLKISTPTPTPKTKKP